VTYFEKKKKNYRWKTFVAFITTISSISIVLSKLSFSLTSSFFFDMSTQEGGEGIRISDLCFMRRSPAD